MKNTHSGQQKTDSTSMSDNASVVLPVSLRDWFAGMALAAIPHIGCGCDLNTKDVAITAYQFADAMIAAREGKP